MKEIRSEISKQYLTDPEMILRFWVLASNEIWVVCNEHVADRIKEKI